MAAIVRYKSQKSVSLPTHLESLSLVPTPAWGQTSRAWLLGQHLRVCFALCGGTVPPCHTLRVSLSKEAGSCHLSLRPGRLILQTYPSAPADSAAACRLMDSVGPSVAAGHSPPCSRSWVPVSDSRCFTSRKGGGPSVFRFTMNESVLHCPSTFCTN